MKKLERQINELIIAAGNTMDFAIYWTMARNVYEPTAERLNKRGDKILRLDDKRTKGAKYLAAMEAFERRDFISSHHPS